MGSLFIADFCGRIDANNSARFLYETGYRWLGLRLEFLSVLFLVFTAAVNLILTPLGSDNTLGALAVTFAQNLSGALNWLGV